MTVIELVIAIMDAFDSSKGDMRLFLATVDTLVKRSGLPKPEAQQAKWIASTRLHPTAGFDPLELKRYDA